MKIKQYLSKIKQMKMQTHCIKITRGIVGIIPFFGPLLVEYLPEASKNDFQLSKEDKHSLLNFIKNSKKERRSWFSSDSKHYVRIDGKFCEQQGNVNVKSHNVYILFYAL